MISGVINICKEAGFTSHDVVAKLRGILHQKKIGHTGTLDPDAVGVLPVCLGKATRLADVIAGESKTYETVLRLGIDTDTEDISGKILSEKDVCCSEEDVKSLLPRFLGEQDQIPPMYSAKKQDGRKLYELARKGITVERKPARIHIAEITLLSMELPRIRLRVTCSKGTYIRTLCHDIGKALGCGGCMEKLTRTQVGPFQISDAHTLAETEKLFRQGCLNRILLSPDFFFRNLPAAYAAAEADRLAENGNGIPVALIETEDEKAPAVRMYHSGGAFLGIYDLREDACMFFPRYFLHDEDNR